MMPSPESRTIMRDALMAITQTGRSWGTSGDGHARCIQLANDALQAAEDADINAEYARLVSPPPARAKGMGV